jgi:hypothetical protein
MRAILPSGSPRSREYSHGIAKAKSSNKNQAMRRMILPTAKTASSLALSLRGQSLSP